MLSECLVLNEDEDFSFHPQLLQMTKLAERIERVKETIASACARSRREVEDVRLVIVTKSAGIEEIEEVVRLGFNHLGENRVLQLKKVAGQVAEFLQQHADDSTMPKTVHWHMIGHLQRNKVRQVLPTASLIHSVDTLRLAEEINGAANKLGLRPRVLLQVNTSNEPQKYGVPVGAATHLAEQIETLPNLRLIGLMTMAPLTRDQDVIRTCFARAHELFCEMRGEKIVGPQFTELSMGMSSDYEIAVEEGATILRIGSAIFAGS
ncbi:MAG: YggS family pyridoxal phosphate-dependent enzyme [Sedimentisphaerales bacterium]|jgi:pyridoxal phosphate enzyme (YggS family)|nr:YggS family pyridoxal phosphate-dependent enzyme [Sedimentisphaerales bacterium]HNY77705.1 YggS family pyridoxal phosphate-dependent enzyme [Sedimentisphaerales bacterium]HOC63449.1 YggS family pyridoxal phosphate-dependent enzyme [Sedimentisphaerales bacterium]HOH63880.1 YggS family pyridoxal phosphate-dependent enzyme [Sedimentisphaerales bacterium]HPY49801.1 YggS family pyridoxal phosphate-dependent enzyme [Sedimentisphaerales bacterium]